MILRQLCFDGPTKLHLHKITTGMMNLKIGTIIVMDELLANFQISAPFSDRLHCRYAITVHVYQLGMNSDEEKV
jgi:ABC-type polysaccharide/polyol phosphate transport system ATPase subunit